MNNKYIWMIAACVVIVIAVMLVLKDNPSEERQASIMNEGERENNQNTLEEAGTDDSNQEAAEEQAAVIEKDGSDAQPNLQVEAEKAGRAQDHIGEGGSENAADDGQAAQVKPAPDADESELEKDPAAPTDDRYNQLVSSAEGELLRLRAECEGSLSAIADQYLETGDNGLIAQGTEQLGQCDADFNGIVTKLEADLTAGGYSTEAVQAARNEYETTKKAALLAMLLKMQSKQNTEADAAQQ